MLESESKNLSMSLAWKLSNKINAKKEQFALQQRSKDAATHVFVMQLA